MTELARDEIVELMARGICLEAGRMGDTEAVERNRVEADWPRHVHTALQALHALEAAGCQIVRGWLPIESAPKDGEPVLIWKPDERMVGEYMMMAYWSEYNMQDDAGWVPVGGVNKQGYRSSVTHTDQGYPTHWMPRPAPPAGKVQP